MILWLIISQVGHTHSCTQKIRGIIWEQESGQCQCFTCQTKQTEEKLFNEQQSKCEALYSCWTQNAILTAEKQDYPWFTRHKPLPWTLPPTPSILWQLLEAGWFLGPWQWLLDQLSHIIKDFCEWFCSQKLPVPDKLFCCVFFFFFFAGCDRACC